jgi:ribonuclease J
VDRKKEEFVYDRDYVEMKPYEKYQIGSLEIEMLPVDHSLPGACGYIIYSDEGNLVYTGDIRFHGYVEEQSNEFVARAKASSPRWMISEGTRIDSDRIDSEEGVKKDISAAISDAKGLVLIEHPIRDLYRAKSIYDATKENGRDFVVGLKLAYLINLMGELSPFNISDVKILIPRKKWGLISKEPFDWPQVCQDYDKWEREFLDRDNSITFKNLKKNEDSFVLSMNL